MEEKKDVGPSPQDEWTIAALAHASILLVLVLGSVGIGLLLGPLVPLIMYLSYRERSRFIAFHALQAFAYQMAGVVGYFVLVAVLVSAVVIAWVVSGLLTVVLIGFLLMPLALILTLLMVFGLVIAPFAWIGYGAYGAYSVYRGERFRYWLIGEWIEREVSL